MSDSININTLNSGNTQIGGTSGVIAGSGIVNVYGDQLDQLRVSLDELVKTIDANEVLPAVRNDAELARAEAAKPRPEPSRLRELIDAVIAGAGKVAAVTQAALNVMAVITIIEKAFS